MEFRINTLITVFFCGFLNLANAQTTTALTLDKCYQLAKENYPLVKQYDLLEKSREYTIKNASKAYLPQFRIGGTATYQSDVTSIPITLPNIDIPTLSKDRYKLYGEVTMPITGLFTVKHQKVAVEAESQLQKKNLDVQIYQLQSRIHQLYFGILLMNAQLEQIDAVITLLQSSIQKDSIAIANGSALKSSASVLKAELLQTEQKTIVLLSNKKQYIKMLSLFIHQTIDDNAVFETPKSIEPVLKVMRPKLDFFTFQQQQLSSKKQLLNDKILPQFNLFFQGGLGRPGLNMLRNDFTGYYIGGLRLSWNITPFYTQKKDQQILSLKQKMIENEKNTFLFNTQLSFEQKNEKIIQLKKLIETDQSIVALRTTIRISAENKLKFGTITSNDYLKYVTDESHAKQAMILHQIQLLKAQYESQIITGN